MAKGEGFEGFEEKVFKESCLKDQKTSLKQEVFRNSKGEVFVVSSESGLKCGVCGIDEELEGEVDLSGGVARGAPPERLEGTVFPGGVASKAPPGRLEGLGDKRELVRLGDPRRPSEQEVEDHCLSGHLPYRNWCYHCVRGRGRDLDHRKGIEEERGLSEFSFDYCFPGDEFGFKLTILAGSERATGMKMATVVPEKGSSGRFSAGKCLEFMEECGDGNCDVIVKTDQEPSIGILVQDIKEMRESRTVVEESPVGSHQSNGIIERSVQGVEGQLRVLKSALEGRIGKRISAERRIVKFMAEYGAYLLNRLEVGKDGKTAYERVRGKKGRVLGVEFGEKLLWKVRPKERLEKIQPRWEYGIFVGVKRKGGEVWVATKEGGMKAVRSVRRIPVEERWGEDCLNWVKNVPWNRGDGGEDRWRNPRGET